MNESSQIAVLLFGQGPDDIRQMEVALASLGTYIASAVNATEAAAALKNRRFAAMVISLHGDVHANLAMASELRQIPGAERIPLVFIVPDAESLRVLSGSLLELADGMSQPFEPALLRSKVHLFCDLYRQRQALDDRNRQIVTELELATKVQRGFLPRNLPDDPNLLFGRHYETSASLGGDIYDVFNLARGRYGFYMADAAGHGVSAALLSGLAKMSFEALKEHLDSSRLPVSELLDPSVMLTMTNAALHEGLPSEAFITLLYAVIEPRQQSIRLSSAGHPYPILIRASTGDVSYVKIPTGPALGPIREAYFPTASLEFFSKDTILFYTDGLTEAMNEAGEEFGSEQLLQLVRYHRDLDPAALVDAVVEELTRFRDGAPPSDDCSLFIIRAR